MQLTPYALPAIVSLLIKAGIFFYARHSRIHNLQTHLFLLFLFSLAIQNLAEIQFFLTSQSEQPNVSNTGRWWYSAAILAPAFLLHLALLTGVAKWGNRRQNTVFIETILVYSPAFALEALLWGTDLLIVDFEPMGYTVTQTPGALYFLFRLYAIAYLCAAVGLLINGCRNQTTTFKRLQSKFLVIGLAPFVILAVTILILRHLGFRGFNATSTLPLTFTFFLAVTGYATHQHRLFDIEFFIPWSKIRKRKSAFYQRIQATIAAIAELRSVREITQLIANTLHCQLALIGGPQPVTAFVGGQEKNRDELPLSKFPRGILEEVERITVAQEVADIDPELYRAMETYRVGAIVPFKSHGKVATHWLVLGDHFSNEVYTPLDFQIVERLFAAMAERFLDDFLYVRSQLTKTEEQLRRTTLDLGHAWHEEHEAKRKLNAIRTENRELRDEIAQLRRAALEVPKTESSAQLGNGKLTLEEYLSVCEKEAVVCALDRCGGDKLETGRLLGVTLDTLEYLMERHDISEDSWTIR